jgi:alpha-glucoside transport system substrate-binding protein
MHELRDELALLSMGEWVAWQRIGGSYDLLRRALVEAVRGNEGVDPGPLLEECWSLLSSPQAREQVARFHRREPHYAGVDVDAARLHRNACALMATARAAHAARVGDVLALARWASVAGALLGWLGTDEPVAVSDKSPAPAAELVDRVFRTLSDQGGRVQGARMWTMAWLPRSAVPPGSSHDDARPTSDAEPGLLDGPSVRVPVAGCFDSKGFLADLCLYRLPGDGELVPHPETALQPLGTQLLGALRAVWEPCGQSVCFTFGVRDASVPSWVPLEGTSLSGAVAHGLKLLARGHEGDVGRVIIAQVGADGVLEPVGHEKEKMQAALEGGVRSVVLAADSPVPETCTDRYRQSGLEVVRARTLREALELPLALPTGRKKNKIAIALAVSVSLVLAGLWFIGGTEDCPSSSKLTLVAAAVWSDNEQKAFESVLDEFCERTGISVKYIPSTDDDMAKYLDLVACNPPDVVMLAQPGLLRELAKDGRLYPLSREAVTNLDRNYTQASKEVGAVNGVQYGVYFKAANKSMWWYNDRVLDRSRIEPITDLEQLLHAAETVSDSGTPWLTIGGKDGWPLTDLFENIYIRTAGADNYDKLAAREIPWDHPTVIDALEIMNRLLENRHLMGGTSGALGTDWETSVLHVVSGRAATTFEGDFVLGYADDHAKARAKDDLRFFDFPSINGSPPAVIGGGDIGVALSDKPEAQRLLEFLATPEAAAVWAQRPGFTSPNRNVDERVYPDSVTRRAATTLASAEVLRFDLSDQEPTSFGTKENAGMWLRLQQFLEHRDPIATARALESDRATANTDILIEDCPAPSP